MGFSPNFEPQLILQRLEGSSDSAGFRRNDPQRRASAFVPLSLGLHHFSLVEPHWVFLSGLVAIAVLADWVRRATEQVAEHAGSAIGSLLNVTFGNAAELVLALFVLSRAQTQVVQAQITGSIIGTTLLFLGVAVLVGGVRHAADLQQGAGRAAVHPASAADRGHPVAGVLQLDGTAESPGRTCRFWTSG